MDSANDETKKFQTAIRSAVRLIRQVASYAGEEYKPLEQKALRAVDRAHDWTRFQADPGAADAQCRGVHAAWRFATRSGAAARKEARYAEIARLRRLERETRVEEGGFLKELRLSAMRQGRAF